MAFCDKCLVKLMKAGFEMDKDKQEKMFSKMDLCDDCMIELYDDKITEFQCDGYLRTTKFICSIIRTYYKIKKNVKKVISFK